MTSAPTPSPSKKPFTDDIRASIGASDTHHNAVVPEALSRALQNIGMRVRKSVTEGYNTERISTHTVPATPNSSPAKQSTAHATPTPVFTTGNAALNSVFPAGCAPMPLTPSPRKRARAVLEPGTGTNQSVEEDIEMGEDGSENEGEAVILGPNENTATFAQPRKIKPLRFRLRTTSSRRDFVGSLPEIFTVTSQASSSPNNPSLLAASLEETHYMDSDLSRADNTANP